ncbi:MAG: RHS repeat-associated core domain-containing protein [Deltaproteobacteria bacterium]|nr:RHS repeat-associated core domain-containing protein [Deltaproteobacteria bacterium]
MKNIKFMALFFLICTICGLIPIPSFADYTSQDVDNWIKNNPAMAGCKYEIESVSGGFKVWQICGGTYSISSLGSFGWEGPDGCSYYSINNKGYYCVDDSLAWVDYYGADHYDMKCNCNYYSPGGWQYLLCGGGTNDTSSSCTLTKELKTQFICTTQIESFSADKTTFNPYTESVNFSWNVINTNYRRMEIKKGSWTVADSGWNGWMFDGYGWGGRYGYYWDVVPEGVYTAILTAKSGDEKCIVTKELPITVNRSCNSIESFTADKTIFNPYTESVKLTGKINTNIANSWKVEIKKDGGLITTSNWYTGSFDGYTWGGRDSIGKVLPDGNYTVVLSAKTSDGKCLDIKEISVTVKTVCDKIESFNTDKTTINPYKESAYLTGIIGNASGKPLSWTIDIKDSTGNIRNTSSGSGKDVSAGWSGRDNIGQVVPDGDYKAELNMTTNDGLCKDKKELGIKVYGCDIKITSFDGNDKLIDPSSGGNILLTGEIFDSSGKTISWKVTLAGKEYEGIGTAVTVIWDGKDAQGKVVDEGTYTATLEAKIDDTCKDTKSIDFEVVPPPPNTCGLYVDFGSSANTASGNLSHNQELFSTKGSGLSASMSLYYTSQDSHNISLGMGWSHSYDITVKANSDGSVVFRDGNGKKKLYEYSNGVYTSQQGDYSTLTRNADSTITHKEGTRYAFNAAGKISAITDRNGNAITFMYSTDGDLTTITDSAGRITTLSYNADHRIATINDPNGNTHSFTYSGDDLIGVTTQPGDPQITPTSWSYSYYDNSFMQSKTDPNGYTTIYTYDEDHRVATSTDPEGNVKSIVYPYADDTSVMKTTTVKEKDGGEWTYSYDTQAGTLTKKIDPDNGVTSYIYDENKSITSKSEPDGTTISYTYDTSGNMASTTDALGETTTYTYNNYGQATSISAADGTTTSYEYDANGNLTKTTDSTGGTTSYQYDTKGNVTSITNAAGQTTTFTYDQSGNLSSIKDSTGATTSFTYDTAGNMTSQTDASGATTRFEYNSFNQLVKVIDPNGNSTTNTYDNNGNKTSSTDANGNITYYEYNYKGQLTKVNDALGNVTTYTYGGTGCSSCGGGTDKLTAITDANGSATKYEYDTLGRLVKETDPLGNAISYSYDSKGNLISKIDGNGASVTYTYDSLGRLTKKAYPDNTTDSFTYDAKGNILTASNPYSSYTFTYNTNGKATSVTDSSGRTVSYQYDTLGNKTKLTYPEGSTATYSYDSANRLTKITNGGGKTYSYRYDSLGRRTKLSLPNGTSANYSYDTSGRLTNLSHKTSSGSTIASFAYTHDNVGNRLTKSLDTGTKYTYAYDSIYRLTEALSSTPGYSSNTNTKGSGTTTATQQQKEYFSYDPVGNRLTSDTSSAYTYNQANQLLTNGGTYTYDKNGNLTAKIDGTTIYSYSYDYENRLTKVIKTESSATTTSEYKYDPFGRRIEKKVTESGTTTTTKYVYDNEDIILEYDGSNSTGNRYIHGPGIDEPLAVINGKNTYYYHADALGSIVALTDSAGKTQQTYEYDSFGNLKDQKNKVKQPYTYTGREWDKEAGLYFYRARYYDSVVGRFTSFDPILHPANGPPAKKGCGSSSSEPSFNVLLSRPLELNPFIYTLSDPVNNTDPYGKSVIVNYPYPLLPPSPENCSHYKNDCDCGSQVACTAYSVCTNSLLNGNWWNCVRGCLKDKYLNRVSDAQWLAVDHPVCYASCPLF